jgi:hypothetical protein
MLGTQLAQLLDGVPAGTGEALDLVASFDDCLVRGFARLGQERIAALAAFAGGVAATPLGAPAGEAVEKIAAGSVADAYLTVLAATRAALLGAAHDALLAGLDGALGPHPRAMAGPAHAATAAGAGGGQPAGGLPVVAP